MLKDIEEALEKATPGPWKANIGMCEVSVYDPTDTYPLAILDFKNNDNDAILIANAPEWLRHLLSIISQKDEEIADVKEYFRIKQDQVWALQAEIERITKLNHELASEQKYAKEQAIKWNDEAVKRGEEIERLTSEIMKVPEGESPC